MRYLLASTVAGIWVSSIFGLAEGCLLLLLSAVIAAFLIRRSRSRHDFATIVWICAFLVLGMLTGIAAVAIEDLRAAGSIAALQGQPIETKGVVKWVYESAYGKQYVLGRMETAGKKVGGALLVDEDDIYGAPEAEITPGDILIGTAEVGLIKGPENAGGFDARSFWYLKGVHAKALSLSVTYFSRQRAGIWTEAAFWLSKSFRKFTEEALANPVEKALIDAIALSDKSGLGPEERSSFETSGMSHLMSASGIHISIIIGLVTSLMGIARAPMLASAAAVILLLPAYMIAAGARASVIRAFIMGTASLLFKTFGKRRPQLLDLTISAAFVQLIMSPMSLFDPGFQMSYLAIAGLIAFEGRKRKAAKQQCASKKLLGYLSDGIMLSVFITAAMLPILTGFYGSISLLSPLANVIAIPAASAALGISFVSYMISLIFRPLGLSLLLVARPFLMVVMGTADFLSGIESALIDTGKAAKALGLMYYLVIGSSYLVSKEVIYARWILKFMINKAVSVALPILAGLILTTYMLGPKPVIRVLSVGQGDSILVTRGNKLAVLFDTGPGYGDYTAAESRILPALRYLGVDRIDVLVLTHGHQDHTAGIGVISESLDIGAVVIPAGDSAAAYAAVEAGFSPIEVTAGTLITNGDLKVEFLNPSGRLSNDDDLNEGSLVARISIEGSAVLLEADAGYGFERMYRSGYADFLKVGHHGSSTSATYDFLQAANPAYAAISVGTNRYGHPSRLTIERIIGSGSSLYRTDENGMVEVIMTANGIEISSISDSWSLKPFFRMLGEDAGSRIKHDHAVK